MIIHHLAPKPFAKYRGKLFSPLASVRLRALEPAPFLARLGHKVKVVPMEDIPDAVRQGTFFDADLYVVQKAFLDLSPVLDELRARGKRIVVDVCDHVFALPQLSGHYPAMLQRADLVTTSSEALADLVREVAGVPAVCVPDCVELPRGVPALPAVPPKPLRLLWFGRSDNAGPLLAALPALAGFARERPCMLEVVCDATPEMSAALDGAAGPLHRVLTPWSPDAVEAGLAACQFVLLPSSEEPNVVVKSANRLQEALWAGRMPVAHPLRSYLPFADSAIVTASLADGLQWALDHWQELPARIAAGQAAVAETAAPEAVARAWNAALTRVEMRPRGTAPASAAVRLNLGCGDKLLPGYVNVDIAESRAGVRPDVLCDLHHLTPFADASADEILAVHVIEHFWRWEVVDILREWVRVLKPGGRMVLECPNLRTACEHFLKDPDTFAQPDARGQHSMWVFYGDPQWRDPLMVHRWGYTPETLMQVMGEAGLTELRREPAQFKMGEPRDMRVVGHKPR